MNDAIAQMLARYNARSLQDQEQALREILQEVALVGLWRGKFFEHAAFYGGTALRIFYGLDRFSEDLDFTLITADSNWSWTPYAKVIKQELNSYGFEVTFIEKEKTQENAIKSAFLKASTFQEMLKIGVTPVQLKGIHRDSVLRIKIEIDTDPFVPFSYEQKFLEQPLPISIKCVDEQHLFAAKMHAALFRAWKGRVKGRDWYDVIWFIRKKTPLNLTYFSRHRQLDKSLSKEAFLQMAKERIDSLDIDSAIQDILVFVKDPEAITQTWSKPFFYDFFDRIIFAN